MKKSHKKILTDNKFTLCPLCNKRLKQTGASVTNYEFNANYTCTCCGAVYNYYQNHFFSWNHLFSYERIKHIGRNSSYIDKIYMRKLKINDIINKI